MAVTSTTIYSCDVPACPSQWSGDGDPPEGWTNVHSNSISYNDHDCDCECHTCEVSEEVELTGHSEGDCPCYRESYSWHITCCPNHSSDMRRRYR